MKIANVHLKSLSPYSQSRNHDTPKLQKETSNDYEERTWRERVHADPTGRIIIPPMAFKNCLSEAAKFLGEQIPGKGKSTYTKHIEAGVLVLDPLVLPIRKDQVEGERLFLNADGKRGSGTRVWKRMPLIPKWEGTVVFHLLDPMITEEVFERHLTEAGRFIGIGRFRPRQNGIYGRFAIEKIKWVDA
jgi:hypothetical protein